VLPVRSLLRVGGGGGGSVRCLLHASGLRGTETARPDGEELRKAAWGGVAEWGLVGHSVPD
jgi:hypothetical protein